MRKKTFYIITVVYSILSGRLRISFIFKPKSVYYVLKLGHNFQGITN